MGVVTSPHTLLPLLIRRNNMFDNWLKSLDEIHTYKYWKKQIIQWNEKTIQFCKDAYEDLTSKKDKD
jgi:hypothetical protein